jgi:glycosyltransferase involved in cell wall biosynthesis
MRVALVSLETTRHSDTASTRRLERIAEILAGRGHDVTVFCSQWWDDYCDELYVEGVRYRGVTYGTALSSFCTRLPALLARYRPDIVHAGKTPPQQVLAALTGSRLARAPLIVEWYGDESIDESSRLLGTVTGRPDRLVTPSELVRTELRELGASGENTMVIPESIDFSQVSKIEPADDVDIIYARKLDEAANLDDFLLGLAEFRQLDWEATVVGDGPLRSDYEREAEKLRIDDHVTFVGDCDRERRISLYRGAHAFVHTARREEFATELLWALACGCVGIVEYQEQSSAHELIEHYDRSYRVSNPSEIASAIDDASEFSEETVDDEWADYDHSAIIERYLSLYRELQNY